METRGKGTRQGLWGPGLFRADLSLQKIFKITERTRFKLQWEAYNAFNRANYSNPNGNIDQSTAGVINGLADIMRQMPDSGGTLAFLMWKCTILLAIVMGCAFAEQRASDPLAEGIALLQKGEYQRSLVLLSARCGAKTQLGACSQLLRIRSRPKWLGHPGGP